MSNVDQSFGLIANTCVFLLNYSISEGTRTMSISIKCLYNYQTLLEHVFRQMFCHSTLPKNPPPFTHMHIALHILTGKLVRTTGFVTVKFIFSHKFDMQNNDLFDTIVFLDLS